MINGHIDNTVRNTQYAQPPHLFLNTGSSLFARSRRRWGCDFAAAKVGRGAAFGDLDNDLYGDLDVLITTNRGPLTFYRNDGYNGK